MNAAHKNECPVAVGQVVKSIKSNATNSIAKPVKFKGTDNPRWLRAIHAVPTAPRTREQLDEIVGCSTRQNMTWTELPDKSGKTMTTHIGTYQELVARVRDVGTFPSKDKCPWIKLATFGDQRTDAGSLRSNDNLTAVYGIEGDYDGEVMTMAQAAELLESYGIRALLYPSPSSTAQNPRWRVLCPLAKQHPPSARAALVARLNGALGGILAGESFILSQGYYFGATPTNDYQVLLTFDDAEEGSCIDNLDELDEIAMGKSVPADARADQPGKPLSIGAEMFEVAVQERGRLLKTGDGRRTLLTSYISSRSARYAPAGDIRAMVKGIAAQYFDPADPIDEANIEAIVKHYVTKDCIPHIDFSGLTIDNVTGEVLGPLLKPVSVFDVLTNPAPPPAFIWDGYLPRGVVTLMGAHGGTGKSTIALMLAVCAALGRPLFGVDTEACKVLFVSLEDGANIVRHRLAHICRAWGVDPEQLRDRLHIVDGTEHPELYAAETRGAGEITASYFELRKIVQSQNVGLVLVDNASDAFGGDEIQRRQVRAFMRSLREVARLTDCAVMLLAHVDKATSRNKKPEGGEGYSGSTAWHNSARSRLFMTRGDDGLLTLEHQKSNLGRMREPVTLEWLEDGLPQLVADSNTNDFTAKLQGRADDDRAIALLKLIAEFEGRGQYCSPAITSRNHVHAALKSEPAFQKIKLRPDDTKRIVTQCQRAKWIEPLDYKTPDRKPHQRWTVTPEGRLFAGLPAPTAPTAPTTENGASQNMAQGSAPTAPTGVGGVGERAHTQDGAAESAPTTESAGSAAAQIEEGALLAGKRRPTLHLKKTAQSNQMNGLPS